MLTICCTKKLLDELKLKPCDITEGKPFFSWYTDKSKPKASKTV